MSSSSQPGAPRQALCPICGRPAEERRRPFCSRRCADIDLHRWLAGVYSVPAVEAEPEQVPAQDADDPPRGPRRRGSPCG